MQTVTISFVLFILGIAWSLFVRFMPQVKPWYQAQLKKEKRLINFIVFCAIVTALTAAKALWPSSMPYDAISFEEAMLLVAVANGSTEFSNFISGLFEEGEPLPTPAEIAEDEE